MLITETIESLQEQLAPHRKEGSCIGIVPTMGALHKGHANLIKTAAVQSDVVVTTIFVNPTQFNDPNDLRNYPRTIEEDIALCSELGTDILFVPSVKEIYPQKDTRTFDFGTLGMVMEGKYREGHFNGVAQVVSRLFDIVKPCKAFFGKKDYQQLAIIRRLVEILDLDIKIVGCPTVREPDGLAMSSRNMLLTPTQRANATTIARVLTDASNKKSQLSVKELVSYVEYQINNNTELEVEYFQVVDSKTLQPIDSWSQSEQPVACIAVKVGKVRLIDNIEL